MQQTMAIAMLEKMVEDKKQELEVLIDLLNEARQGRPVHGVLIEQTVRVSSVREDSEYGTREVKEHLSSRVVTGINLSGGPPPTKAKLLLPTRLSA